MNIEFESIEAQNFKSIGDLISINYKDFNGLNFVVGVNQDKPGSKNGCGKTVLLADCLTFALFGRTLKPLSNQHLANKYYNKKAQTFAKVIFKADNIRYRSECYCNKSTQKMFLYIEDQNEETGWKDITQSSIIKTKQYIQDEILKCTFDVFKTTIIISAADCLNFYQGMSKQQKRQYIETIFNLDCFGNIYDLIKTDLNNTKKEISYTNSQLLNLTNQLTNIQNKFDTYQNEIKDKSNKIKNIIIEQANICKEKKVEKENSEKELLLYDNIIIEYNNINNELKELEKEKNILENNIYKSDLKIKSIQTTISEIEKIKDGLCEVCKEIVNTKYDYNKQLKGINVLNKLINDNNNKINIINDNIQSLQTKYNEYSIKLNNKNELEQKINILNIEISNIKNNLIKLKIEYDESENNVNPFKELLSSTLKIIENTTNKLNELNILFKHLDILKNVCSENGVKQFIIKDIVVLLNSLIQQYLNEIGSDFVVYFDESFDFKFMTLAGELEYNNFSAGERQRLQIATLLAFRDLILNGKINSNILIIDEVLDIAIDALAIKRIISILQRKTIDMNQALFIISHRSEITDETVFNHILEIKKKNGISELNII